VALSAIELCDKLLGGPATHPGKHEHIEEVHGSKDQEHDADFAAYELNDLAQVSQGVGRLEREGSITGVDQIETDNEKLIHRIGERALPWNALSRKMRPPR
jgi:hypothetical protein